MDLAREYLDDDASIDEKDNSSSNQGSSTTRSTTTTKNLIDRDGNAAGSGMSSMKVIGLMKGDNKDNKDNDQPHTAESNSTPHRGKRTVDLEISSKTTSPTDDNDDGRDEDEDADARNLQQPSSSIPRLPPNSKPTKSPSATNPLLQLDLTSLKTALDLAVMNVQMVKPSTTTTATTPSLATTAAAAASKDQSSNNSSSSSSAGKYNRPTTMAAAAAAITGTESPQGKDDSTSAVSVVVKSSVGQGLAHDPRGYEDTTSPAAAAAATAAAWESSFYSAGDSAGDNHSESAFNSYHTAQSSINNSFNISASGLNLGSTIGLGQGQRNYDMHSSSNNATTSSSSAKINTITLPVNHTMSSSSPSPSPSPFKQNLPHSQQQQPPPLSPHVQQSQQQQRDFNAQLQLNLTGIVSPSNNSGNIFAPKVLYPLTEEGYDSQQVVGTEGTAVVSHSDLTQPSEFSTKRGGPSRQPQLDVNVEDVGGGSRVERLGQPTHPFGADHEVHSEQKHQVGLG